MQIYSLSIKDLRKFGVSKNEYKKFKGIFTFGGDTSSYKGEERLL